MILADFALVMTLLPASVIILETKINPWWRRTCKKVKAKNQTAEGGAPDEADSPQPRKLEVFFGGKFADFVLQYRKYIIAAHLVLTIVSITVPAALLRMSNEEYTFAPPEHLLSRLESYPKKFQPEESFSPANLVLVAGLKASDPWSLADAYPVSLEGVENSGPWGNGKLHYQSDFDVGANQQEFIVACSAFHENMKKTKDARAHDVEYNIMADFAKWALWKGHGFPVNKDKFASLMIAFNDAPDGLLNASMRRYKSIGESPFVYRQRTGILMNKDKNDIKLVWCGFNITSLSSGFGDAYGDVDTVQKRMDDALVVAEEKSGMKNMYHTSIKWLFNRMIATTFEFAVMSLVISYCIACGVIMLVTGNWKVTIISAYVLLSIISFSLMGLVVCGYEMSLNECCVILVAAGMSVDYLLHMAHSFNHSKGSKEERVRQSLKEMGISVLSGAITTMSAAISLCFCVFYIYSRLGVYLLWLISSAFVYSVTALTALLAEFGPNFGEALIPWIGKIVHASAKHQKGAEHQKGEDKAPAVEMTKQTV